MYVCMYVLLLSIDVAYVARGMYKSNVGKKTKIYNSGGYFLQDSSGKQTAEFYRAGEDDGFLVNSHSLCLSSDVAHDNSVSLNFKGHASSVNDCVVHRPIPLARPHMTSRFLVKGKVALLRWSAGGVLISHSKALSP